MDAEVEKVKRALKELWKKANSVSDVSNLYRLNNIYADNIDSEELEVYVDSAMAQLDYEVDLINEALQNNDEDDFEDMRECYEIDAKMFEKTFRDLADIFHNAINALERYL